MYFCSMEKMKLTRIDKLRFETLHYRSGAKIITDAPVDNNGKGESFSPTDLMCVSLASCMLTIFEIAAASRSIDVGVVSADITKHMASNPRRIQQIDIHINFENQFDSRTREILENAAKSCPVMLSMNADVIKNVVFEYGVKPTS